MDNFRLNIADLSLQMLEAVLLQREFKLAVAFLLRHPKVSLRYGYRSGIAVLCPFVI